MKLPVFKFMLRPYLFVYAGDPDSMIWNEYETLKSNISYNWATDNKELEMNVFSDCPIYREIEPLPAPTQD